MPHFLLHASESRPPHERLRRRPAQRASPWSEQRRARKHCGASATTPPGVQLLETAPYVRENVHQAEARAEDTRGLRVHAEVRVEVVDRLAVHAQLDAEAHAVCQQQMLLERESSWATTQRGSGGGGIGGGGDGGRRGGEQC